ncbi:sulfotransferase 1C2-like [Tachypleus tridentatus]|uniref:sulfotransferase 1C2-like n=1 Tax=Tachypleus tridentatus TaxID=6853 RepID=UPI003FD34307
MKTHISFHIEDIAGPLEDEMTDFIKPQTQLIDVLLIPKYLFKEDRVRAAMRFQPKPGDVIIVTFPKFWPAMCIVWEILKEETTPPQIHEMFGNELPFLELTGTETVEHIPPPRAFKVHFPFAYTLYSSKCKYIVVVRNPWDCCVSYFFHTKQMVSVNQFEEGTFDDFFECFIRGQVAWNDYFDHLISWFIHKDDPNVLFLTYENMKNNHREAVIQIAHFLGKE